jgi:cellulose synthase/poly-beta-1,6-N-acetylglucosamine synthase-like glycosyltransferase
MFHPWLTIPAALAGLALLESFLLSCQSWEHRRFTRNRLRPRLNPDLGENTSLVNGVNQRAVLFAPCKGIDVGFKENLRPLFCQDYDDYELVFIVESDHDPACSVIRKLIAEHTHVDCRLLVAGQASDTGQKVHNLRAATRQLAPEVEILAFVDSDARPHPAWLGQLVQRLGDPGVGIVTGY